MTRLAISKVNCQYGAPMGRHSEHHLAEGKCRLQRLPLSEGYDSGGAYWGCPGAPDWEGMWVAEDSEGARSYFRAKSRAHAKEILLEEQPFLTFYR